MHSTSPQFIIPLFYFWSVHTTFTIIVLYLPYWHALHHILSHARLKWLYSPALAPETEDFPETRADDESRDRGESSAELGFTDGEPVK